jgi:hypothetical protein
LIEPFSFATLTVGHPEQAVAMRTETSLLLKLELLLILGATSSTRAV